MTGVRFRNATEGDLRLVLSWAAAEGWNPGQDDAAAFFASDPGGFFLAEAEAAPVAAISVVNHTDSFAFLGLYLCLPECRGKGIGYGLWQHALAHAGGRVVGLDGVPDQQQNYRKSGFTSAGETYRFEGRIPAQADRDLRVASGDDLDLIRGRESRANGYAKPAFLTAWATNTGNRQTFVLGHAPRAFATIRHCGCGAKIGPLVAGTLRDAEILLQAIAAAFPAKPFIIDVPDDQTELTALCQGWGLQATFNTARMYRGPAPAPGPGIRSIATMELG